MKIVSLADTHTPSHTHAAITSASYRQSVTSALRTVSSLWLSVTLTVWLSCCGLTSSETAVSTTMSLLSRLCSADVCRNGVCYLVGEEVRCTCGELYYGDSCQHVIMDKIRVASIGDSVILQWTIPPRLKDYKLVYYEKTSSGEPNGIIYTNHIDMNDVDTSILVNKLKSSKTAYKMCIEDSALAQTAVQTLELDLLKHCLDVNTSADYHTLFAWCLAFMLFGAVVLLCYAQRLKIQILYFGGQQFFLDKTHNDTYNLEINMNYTKATSLNSIRDLPRSKRNSLAHSQRIT